MLTKVEFASGIIADESALSAEGGWIAASGMRFRQGKPQTKGGFAKLTSSQFSGGMVRGAKQWADLNGMPHIAYGTQDKLYAITGTTQTEITPIHSEGVFTNIFSAELGAQHIPVQNTTPVVTMIAHPWPIFTVDATWSLSQLNILANSAGSGTNGGCYIVNSSGASITLGGDGTSQGGSNYQIDGAATYTLTNGSGIKAYFDGTQIQTASVSSKHALSVINGSPIVSVYKQFHGLSVGQLITFINSPAVGGITINGTFTVAAIIDASNFTFTAGGNATSTTTGDGPADYSVAWMSGAGSTLPAVWSLDNFGELLLANRRGDGLYCWQYDPAYPEIVQNGTFPNSTGWALGTNWSVTLGNAAHTAGTASDLSQNVVGAMKGGYTYRVKFDVTRSAGTVSFQINAGVDQPAVIKVGDASTPITLTGSYSRTFVCPDNPTDIVFAADAGFIGTIDNVSVKLENKAFRINEAPISMSAMFVDSNRIVHALGTYDASGVFNPLLDRWCDKENLRSWLPDPTNLAGEESLAGGSRIVAGVPTRGQNLIYTDTSLISAQFTGSASGNVYNFRLIGSGCGLIGKNAVCEINGSAFWLSNDGNFYTFQGQIAQIISTCRLNRNMAQNLAAANYELVYAGINSAFSEALWLYPDSRDGSECSRQITYNWAENHFANGMKARTAWLAAGSLSNPIGFGTDGYVYKEEYGVDADGSPLNPYIESSYFDIEDGDALLYISRIVPDFEGQIGDVKFNIFTRIYPNSVESSNGNPYIASTTRPKLDMRRTGRQAKIRIYSDAIESSWRLGRLRLAIDKTDARR